MTEHTLFFEVEPSAIGKRLDAFLAGHPELGLSRSQVERLAKAGKVLVNGRPAPPGRRLTASEKITLTLPRPSTSEIAPAPEPFPLDILFEDEHLLVLNKPRGLVIHPGAGRPSGTLVNALLAHTGILAFGSAPFRPGIVHRLDRDTSGLMVVAKSEEAYADLTRQVRERTLDRRYLALVWGNIREDHLLIDLPIGRHLQDRKRMAAVSRPSPGRKLRSAQTHLTILQRFGPMTLVEAKLITGRTHQIRVHLAHEGHPVVGDRIYGRRRASREHAGLPPKTLALVQKLTGQALHAHRISFRHPVGGQDLVFSAPPPDDMAALLSHLANP